jgi:hypothetical protein
MSEKSAFQLDARAQSPADQQVEVEVSPLAQKKKSIRPRVWKAVYCYFCHNMANSMHRFAIDHAQKAYLARWDEVMVPDVENLVDWIKLFMVSGTCSVETCVLSTSVSSGWLVNVLFIQGISSRNLFAWMGSTAMFVVTVLSFFGYACWYYAVNQRSDRFQAHIVTFVAVAGFSVAMSLGFGVWVSVFVVVPRAVIVGLLVSDFAHLVFPVLRRTRDGCTQSGDAVDEKAWDVWSCERWGFWMAVGWRQHLSFPRSSTMIFVIGFCSLLWIEGKLSRGSATSDALIVLHFDLSW